MMRTAKAVFSLFTLLLMMTGLTAAAQPAPDWQTRLGANTALARTPQLDHDRGLSVSAAEFRRGGNAGDEH